MSEDQASGTRQSPYEIKRCSSCGAPIIWARTVRRRMPIDPGPRSDGNIVLSEPISPGEPPEARYLKKQEQESLFMDEDRYVSHFVTCPDAKRWRKDD